MREVGRRIAAARRARRTSRSEPAAIAYVSLSMVRRIEQGTRLPSDDALDTVATALGLDPGRLLTDRSRTDGRVRAPRPLPHPPRARPRGSHRSVTPDRRPRADRARRKEMLTHAPRPLHRFRRRRRQEPAHHRPRAVPRRGG
ncbi:helix-turn-helix domain-containing protein [Streptomyces roseolilacinus]|uniref:helix-turn-helix domain-containing protein n=1 Tax=Streptomyces roseolilacinus TaxID=66904 RepID=UPI003570DCEF